MKHRLATFLFAFLALALIVAPVSAYWQTRIVYKPSAGGTPLTISDPQSIQASPVATTYTWTGVTFTAGVGILCVQTEDNPMATNTVTFQGNSAPVIDSAYGGTFSGAVTAGTGNIVVTWGNTINYVAMTFAVIHGASSATPYQHSNNAASGTDPATYIAKDIPALGLGVACYGNYSRINNLPYTWTSTDSSSSYAAAQATPASQPVMAMNYKTTTSAITSWSPTTVGVGAGTYMFPYIATFGP